MIRHFQRVRRVKPDRLWGINTSGEMTASRMPLSLRA
jgi:hypothetical protein